MRGLLAIREQQPFPLPQSPARHSTSPRLISSVESPRLDSPRDACRGEPASYLRAPPRTGAGATEAAATAAARLLTSAHAPYLNTRRKWELPPESPAPSSLPDPSRFYRASPIAARLISARPITEVDRLSSSVAEEKLGSRRLFKTWLGSEAGGAGRASRRPPPPGGRSGPSRWLPGSSEQRRLAAACQNRLNKILRALRPSPASLRRKLAMNARLQIPRGAQQASPVLSCLFHRLVLGINFSLQIPSRK